MLAVSSRGVVARAVGSAAPPAVFAAPRGAVSSPCAAVASRYRTFAPRLARKAARAAAAVKHYDGSARGLQILHFDDEPWLHTLLVAIAEATKGPALLVNAPLAAGAGRPLLNTAADALRLLCEAPELDLLVLEDWLFDKHGLGCAR